MSTPTKMSEKNTSLEKKPIRVKSTKSSSADKSPKNMKRKHEEVDVKDSKSEEITKSEESQYVRLVLDSEITRAKINTFVNITETMKILCQWLSPLQYESVKQQPCIQQFMHLDTLGWAGQIFHNIMMRLMSHRGMGDAPCFELGEAVGRFSINDALMGGNTGCNLPYCGQQDVFEEKTIKKNATVHYSIPEFPHALLVWAYETIPSIATKFITKYEPTIPRMTSWTTAENVKFNDVVAAFTTLDEDEGQTVITVMTARSTSL
ncbi:hypothetical protein TIFTF001_021664 [Ficus carica]|uniref:Uncharacterized protein n=1 Tax=Ficus carica TaxID=3494 RepID=A0AA88AAY4_FICCA|nr:hypothetical protein TIFTF001_021664 [Ficus carica]